MQFKTLEPDQFYSLTNNSDRHPARSELRRLPRSRGLLPDQSLFPAAGPDPAAGQCHSRHQPAGHFPVQASGYQRLVLAQQQVQFDQLAEHQPLPKPAHHAAVTTPFKRASLLMLALTLLAPAARAQISWQGQGDAFQVGGLTPSQWSEVAQAGFQGAMQGFDNVADATSGMSQDAASFVADLMTLVFWDPGRGGRQRAKPFARSLPTAKLRRIPTRRTTPVSISPARVR